MSKTHWSSDEHHFDYLQTPFQNFIWWVSSSWHCGKCYPGDILCPSGLEGWNRILEHWINAPCHSGTIVNLAGTSQKSPKETMEMRLWYFIQTHHHTIPPCSCWRSWHTCRQNVYSSLLAISQCSQNHGDIQYVTSALLCENGKNRK